MSFSKRAPDDHFILNSNQFKRFKLSNELIDDEMNASVDKHLIDDNTRDEIIDVIGTYQLVLLGKRIDGNEKDEMISRNNRLIEKLYKLPSPDSTRPNSPAQSKHLSEYENDCFFDSSEIDPMINHLKQINLPVTPLQPVPTLLNLNEQSNLRLQLANRISRISNNQTTDNRGIVKQNTFKPNENVTYQAHNKMIEALRKSKAYSFEPDLDSSPSDHSTKNANQDVSEEVIEKAIEAVIEEVNVVDNIEEASEKANKVVEESIDKTIAETSQETSQEISQEISQETIEEKSDLQKTIKFEVKNVSKFFNEGEVRYSDYAYLSDGKFRFRMQIGSRKFKTKEGPKCLDAFIECDCTVEQHWTCDASCEIRLTSRSSNNKLFSFEHRFTQDELGYGLSSFISYKELTNLNNSFIINDTMVFEALIQIKK